MINKKVGVVFLVILLTLALNLISAELNVKTDTVSAMAIPELNLPAIFNVQFTNPEEADVFNIDTRVVIDIEPKESFSLAKDESKKLTLKVYPIVPIKSSPEYMSLEYRINSKNSPVQIEEISISIADLKDVFNFYADDINPESDKAIIHFNNKAGHSFDNVKLEMSSIFFTQSYEFSLNAYEEKTFEISLKGKEVLAGPYIINSKISIANVTSNTETVINFKEKPNIETSDVKSGWIIQKRSIEKKNTGNTKTEVSISMSKNIFSSLFTSYNIKATTRELDGMKINSLFKKELSPGESLIVVGKTNWFILVIIVVAIFLIYYFLDNYIREKIVLRKRVNYVRTKGGEFALRVSISIKARDFAERIRIIDRLPPMVKVFEKYGLPPDKVDDKNRRIEWNIQALSKGETRELSYIIYSKIGVVGKFELPQAEALYEYKGNIKETRSNRCFYEKI